ncbi:MAG: hypothetical protein H7Z11_11125 [Verrucomicrobia bacterium]|nr:hypothetical protein [Leptolyngbya sp. ES-bin-22]
MLLIIVSRSTALEFLKQQRKQHTVGTSDRSPIATLAASNTNLCDRFLPLTVSPEESIILEFVTFWASCP